MTIELDMVPRHSIPTVKNYIWCGAILLAEIKTCRLNFETYGRHSIAIVTVKTVQNRYLHNFETASSAVVKDPYFGVCICKST